MRAVIVDAGNTHVRFAAWTTDDRVPCFTDGQWQAAPPLRELGRLPTPQAEGGDAGFLRGAAELLAVAGRVPVVVVSVVPRVDALLASLAPDLYRADHTARLPFSHRLADVAATGADRLCNISAAVATGLRSGLVVDAGTATTVDVLRDDVFIGGVIAPGMAFGLEQLGRQAARLRPVPFMEVRLAAGTDTASAMAAGAFHAGVGGVEALVAGLLAAHGPLPVVVTGGLGQFLSRPGRLLDPHWTLRGAAFLAGLA